MHRGASPPCSAPVEQESEALPDFAENSTPSTGTLYIVSLPIGDPEDITLRALRILSAVSLIVAEEARALTSLLVGYPLASEIVSLRPRNGLPARAAALAALQAGKDVALVADCGTPALVDPGLEIVQAALQQGLPVTAVPGAAACMAALVVSGFPAVPFTFFGFPPRTRSGRAVFFARLAATPHTLVLYESPRYLRATLAELGRHLSASTPLCIGYNLTHPTEWIYRGALSAAILEFTAAPPPGAYAVVISGKM